MRIQAPPPLSSENLLRQQRTQFFLFLLIGLCIFFSLSYVGRVMTKMEMERDVEDAEARLALAIEHGQALEAELAFVQSDSYIEGKAREELDMSQPQDKNVVVLPPVAGPPTPEEPAGGSRLLSQIPIWQQWLALFQADPASWDGNGK